MWLQGAFGRSDGRSCRRQNISWTGSSSGLPEPGPRLSESSAAGMNSVRVSQRCTCSGLFFCSDFCKPALTVCLLWAWLSTRRQSHDKQLHGWDLPTLQTAYSFLFMNNWNIDSVKDEWSRRYKCDAQTAAPHSNQITRWRLVITFRPRWQETAAHLCWGGTEWQFGPTDAEKKVHSLRILVLTRLSCCSSTNSSVPELWSRFLQVSWSCWWSPNLKLTFAQISCETLHSCDSHTVVTWLNQPESHDFNYEVLTLVQEPRINNDNNNNHHIFH